MTLNEHQVREIAGGLAYSLRKVLTEFGCDEEDKKAVIEMFTSDVDDLADMVDEELDAAIEAECREAGLDQETDDEPPRASDRFI